MATGLESAFDQQEDELTGIAFQEGFTPAPVAPAPTTDIPAFGDLSNFKVDYGNMDLSSLGTEGKLGDYTPEQFTEFQRGTLQEQLDEYGLSFEDIGDKTFEDYASDKTMETFHTDFQPFVTKRNQESRDELFNLYGTDDENFSKLFESSDVNSQLNFANTLYNEGKLDKEKYTQVAAQALQRQNPNLSYFVDDDLLYSLDTERFGGNVAGAEEVILFDDQFASQAGAYGVDKEEAFKRRLGETNFRDPTDDDSGWVNARDKVIIPLADAALSILSGGMSDVVKTAIKGASGETLHGGDWAVLANAGLQKAGVIAAPTEANPQGTGIGGLDFGQTTGLITAAGTGNPTNFLLNELGARDFLDSALEEAGINSDNLSPEVLSGMGRTVDKLLAGEDFESALESGVGQWARDAKVGGELEETLRQAGRNLDDKYIQPIKDMLPDTPEGIKDIEDTARELGRDVADAAEPFKEPLQETGRFIDDNLLQPAKDALLAGGGAMLTGMVGGGQSSGTRTTDSLFRDELFKFSPVEFTNVERVVQPEQQQIEEEEEMQDLFASPFTSPLDRYTV